MVTQSNGGFLISKIKQIQGRIFERLLQEHGIDAFNGAQGRILFVLWERDGIAISELSVQTGLAKTTLTSMLDRLEASGHIMRLFDPKDRRKVVIRLTDEARALQERYEAVSAQMTAIFYEGFEEHEILVFEENLHRVLKNLRGKEAPK